MRLVFQYTDGRKWSPSPPVIGPVATPAVSLPAPSLPVIPAVTLEPPQPATPLAGGHVDPPLQPPQNPVIDTPLAPQAQPPRPLLARLFTAGRETVEQLYYNVMSIVAPVLVRPLPPEIVEALIRYGVLENGVPLDPRTADPTEITDDELPELTEADYEILADIEEPWQRPTIVLPQVRRVYSSGDLVTHIGNRAASFITTYDKIIPHKIPKDKDDPTRQVFSSAGIEFEAEVWTAMQADYTARGIPDAVAEITQFEDIRHKDYERYCDLCLEATLTAMRAGKEYIYQGFLRSKDGKWEGFPDLLKKVANKSGETSAFGDYHYAPVDIKLASKTKWQHMVQLLLYADMLEQTQGIRPRQISVHSGTGNIHYYDTHRYLKYYQRRQRKFLRDQADFEADITKLPRFPKQREYGKWTTFFNGKIRDRDAVAQVAGITNLQITDRLEKTGIATMSELASTDITHIPGMLDDSLARLKKQARLQIATLGPLALLASTTADEREALRKAGIHYVRSLAQTDEKEIPGIATARFAELRIEANAAIATHGLDIPKFEINPPDPSNPKLGLAGLPVITPDDIFADFESGRAKGGKIEYLLGGITITRDAEGNAVPTSREFWSHTPEDEKKSFEALMDWWYGAWRKNPKMHVWHFHHYEPNALKRLAAKHGTREKEVEELLANGVLTDARVSIKESFTIGLPYQSLKDLEPLWGIKRDGAVKTAASSMAVYHQYQKEPDGATPQESPQLKSIRDYWLFDVVSLYECAEWLNDHAKKLPPPPTLALSDDPDEETSAKKSGESRREIMRREIEEIREALLAMKSRPQGDTEQKRILQFLHDIADFYEREAKPVLWRLFERSRMNEIQLMEDKDCLGGLSRAIGTAYRSPREGYNLTSWPEGYAAISPADANSIPHGVLQPAVHEPVKPKGSQSWYVPYAKNPAWESPLEAGKSYEYTLGEVDAKISVADEEALVKLPAHGTDTVWMKFTPKTWDALSQTPPVTLVPESKRQDTSEVYTYHFDPAQPVTVAPGQVVFFAHDLGVRCVVESIDAKAGIVQLRIGIPTLNKMEGTLPERVSLIPDEFVPTETKERSLIQQLKNFTAKDADGKHRFHPALVNFLRREAKFLDLGATDLDDPAQVLSAVTDAIKNLNGQTLVLQGPPGTGKTYSIVHAMAALATSNRADAKPVAFMMPSHKGQWHAAHMLEKELKATGATARILKIGQEGNQRLDFDPATPKLPADSRIDYVPNYAEALKVIGNYQFVFFSSWPPSRPEFSGKFSHLFVDEAGQVPVADLIAMAPTAKNLIVAGDQNQLGMPTQGAHLGESGMDIMSYYADGKNTLGVEQGFVLSMDYRNHPEIAAPINEFMYDGRLKSHPDTARQKVAQPLNPSQNRLVTKESGYAVVFVKGDPNNTRTSAEEIHAIGNLYDELVGLDYTDFDGNTRPLKREDIMVITPYDLHAKKIVEAIPFADAGTVHKFHGREAPVVIVSLARASTNPYGRDMDFWADMKMLNTAVSRGRALVIFVMSENLTQAPARRISQMEQLNFLFSLLEKAGWDGL